MSNRVDFFQSEQTQLSLPAGTVSILLEGALCPQLELKEIVWGGTDISIDVSRVEIYNEQILRMNIL